MKKWAKRLAIPVALILLGAFFAAPSLVDRWMNRALNAPPYHVSERARLLHEKLLIADLHADTLLWGRDPVVRATHGHVCVGSDFDGAIEAPFDTTGLSLVTEALLTQRFSDEEIAKIMGGNTIRVLLQSLP
jgi:membrane dipeptidase